MTLLWSNCQRSQPIIIMEGHGSAFGEAAMEEASGGWRVDTRIEAAHAKQRKSNSKQKDLEHHCQCQTAGTRVDAAQPPLAVQYILHSPSSNNNGVQGELHPSSIKILQTALLL